MAKKLAKLSGDTDAIRAKFDTFRADMKTGLIEREEEVQLSQVALVAGRNLLLVGEPGTAKSYLCDLFCAWMNGRSFSVTLDPAIMKEDLFGPISLKAFDDERYSRLVDGYAPSADVLFIDEIWKGSPAVFHTLLNILNEHVYKNGSQVVRCPLQLAIAASNEVPSVEDMRTVRAAWDRFLLRRFVSGVRSKSGWEQLVFGSTDVTLSDHITVAEIEQARAESQALPWSSEAVDATRQIHTALTTEGIKPGDRRWKHAGTVAKAAAWLAGESEVRPENLEVLQHVLWTDAGEQPAKCAKVVCGIANPVGMRVNDLRLEADQILAGVDANDIGQVASANAKLRDVLKKLRDCGGNGRATEAADYLAAELKALRIKSLEAAM